MSDILSSRTCSSEKMDRLRPDESDHEGVTLYVYYIDLINSREWCLCVQNQKVVAVSHISLYSPFRVSTVISTRNLQIDMVRVFTLRH